MNTQILIPHAPEAWAEPFISPACFSSDPLPPLRTAWFLDTPSNEGISYQCGTETHHDVKHLGSIVNPEEYSADDEFAFVSRKLEVCPERFFALTGADTRLFFVRYEIL